MYQRENGSVQHAGFLDTVNTVANSVGNLICMGHIKRSLSQGWENLFTFFKGLDRIKGPCMWGIITVWFCLMANAPYFPGVGEVGVYIDGCITRLVLSYKASVVSIYRRTFGNKIFLRS